MNVEFDKKDQIKEDSKTRQNAEYVLTATTCVNILKQYAGNTAPLITRTTTPSLRRSP